MTAAWAAAAALLATGCACLPPPEAHARREELAAANVRRAQPALRAAAEARGAVLLPVRPRQIPRPLDCPGPDGERPPYPAHDEQERCLAEAKQLRGCADRAPDGRSFRYRHEDVGTLLAVPVRADGAAYAGLARRGNRLYLLAAQVARRVVGRATECSCGRMPTTAPCPSELVFLLEEIPGVEIEEVAVPITEDTLEWLCERVSR